MNRFINAIIVALMLTAMPMKHWAQTPYRQYADKGIVLNFFEIHNHDFRLFLLYNLNQDDRFILTPDEEYGLFFLTPGNDNQEDGFIDTFESFYNNASADFGLIDKVDLQDLVILWKASVPPSYFVSITMDLALNRATTVNDHCVDSDPFCTSDLISFLAATTSQTADQLEGAYFDDGCIGSSYNPSWYHMRINTPGQFIIHMEGHDPDTYVERDIDFCMWGPFDDPIAPCVSQLTTNKIIDCNYSAHYSEDIYLGFPENEHHHQASHGTVNYHMPETGEYYIAMICNFSRQPCVITFTKTVGSGPGTTDCGILPGIATNTGPYCVGDTIQLSINEQSGAIYSWTGPNGFTSNEQNPSIPNCTYEMGGTYTCVTTVDGQTTAGTTEVVVFAEPIADFNFNTVCQGSPTQFSSTSITNPPGQHIYSYNWNFGDGQTSTQQNPSHFYGNSGDYQVTLTVTSGNHCTDQITKTVTVYATPVANAGQDQIIPCGSSAQLSGSGGDGDFTYHWEPASMVINPDVPNTQTVALTTHQTFTLTITPPQSQCTDSDQVTVYIDNGPIVATASAEPNSICLGESSQLTATALFGTHNYSYSWTPTTGLDNPNVYNPIASPNQTTTYSCEIYDGQTTQTASTTVTVFQPELSAHIEESNRCDSVPFDWFGNTIYFKEDGIYMLSTESYPEAHTTHGCDTAIMVTVTNMHYSPRPTQTECTTPDAIVFGSPDATADTVAVVSSFQYHFKVVESEHKECRWNYCNWVISKPSWNVGNIITERQPDGYYYSKCMVNVTDHDDDYVILTATASNNCGSTIRKIYLKSSFLDIDENGFTTAKVNIVPNPNNGQMHLGFENMEGQTTVKVFDMTGCQIDAFETAINTNRYNYDYNMKKHADGIYFFVISNNNRLLTKKVVIIQ